METEVLFEEVQQFTRKSTRDFLKGLLGIVFVAVIVNLLLERGIMTDLNLTLIILLPILLIVNIILSSKMVTQIRADGIDVRLPPWQSSFATFYWSNTSEVYVREYNALKEYFGWGIRIGPRGIGYIMAGNTGIQIVLKNGNKILITTQRPEEVNEVLKRIAL